MANSINLGRVLGAKGDTGNTGATGATGQNGLTPYISNGNWWLGNTDTGVIAKGNEWFSGTAVPTSQGVNGDLYLKTDTSDVYKKTDGAWGLITNIKGQQGVQGERGESALTFAIGSVATGQPDQPASVVNVGENGDVVLNFIIPQGQKGVQGDRGEAGTNSIYVGGLLADSVSFSSDPQTQIDGKQNTMTAISNIEIDELFE